MEGEGLEWLPKTTDGASSAQETVALSSLAAQPPAVEALRKR